MIHRPALLPVGTALLALLALPSALRGQEAGRPAPEPTPAERAAQGSDAGSRDAQSRDDGAGTPERSPERDAIAARQEAELEHRERIDAIRSLREIARREGQTDRVAQLDELEASENARYRSATEPEARQPGRATDQSTEPRGRKIIVRKVRTGARASGGSRDASAQPRGPSAGRPPDGRQGTATPESASDRSSRPRTRAESAPPSAGNRKRSGSGSSHTPRP